MQIEWADPPTMDCLNPEALPNIFKSKQSIKSDICRVASVQIDRMVKNIGLRLKNIGFSRGGNDTGLSLLAEKMTVSSKAVAYPLP